MENYWGFLSSRPDRARQQILIAEALVGRRTLSEAFAVSRITADLLALAEAAQADPQAVLDCAALLAAE